MPPDSLRRLLQTNALSEIDCHFGRFMAELSRQDRIELKLGAAFLSNAVGRGDVCLDLRLLAGQPLTEEELTDGTDVFPPLSEWMNVLRSSLVVGVPGDYRPMILDDSGRLYLHKYWHYETAVVEAVQKRVFEPSLIPDIDREKLHDSLVRLFAEIPVGETDWQKIAALTAVFKRLVLICGGPGTGKTFTIARALALLIEQDVHKDWRICLAAPTGKAAARLSDTIRSTKSGLDCSDGVKAKIPAQAQTIHRWLQPLWGTTDDYQNTDHRLVADAMVIDEASMVDLALMSKLLAALPETARLILVGDPDQLASVAAGSVLGDLCDRGRAHPYSGVFCHQLNAIEPGLLSAATGDQRRSPGLQDAIVRLSRQHRFSDNSDIGALCRAVNQGDSTEALRLIAHPENRSLQWQQVNAYDDFQRRLSKVAIRELAPMFEASDPRKALHVLGRFQILSPHNQGPYGVLTLNRLVEHNLQHAGLIHIASDAPQGWYPGRPVMITVNDYRLGLFNGDVGVTVFQNGSDSGLLGVAFDDGDGRVHIAPVHRLPRHETAYAMTVHKSQGSEFGTAHLILPPTDTPLLTRELIYTALSRARTQICIWGSADVFKAAIDRPIERVSGLRDALWPGV